jgi:FkbM family methyltransferase
MPHRVTETLRRLDGIEAAIKDLRHGLPADTSGGADGVPRSSCPSPQQIYRGYSDADLALFERFGKLSPKPVDGFVTDFLGVRTRTKFVRGADGLSGAVTGIPVPDDGFHSDAIEWIGLLKSVASARDRYTAMELGAGWGPWVVAGAAAARQAGLEVAHLCAVEADPGHFEFLVQHFRDNALDPSAHRLINAAVGVEAGRARWPKVDDAAADYGSRPLLQTQATDAGRIADHVGRQFAEWLDVEIVPFEKQLLAQPAWDLVHIDVQGWEVDLCTAAADLLDTRVRWLVVAAHDAKLHGDVIDLMFRHGWLLENEKPPRFAWWAGAPSLTAMTTHDGTQVWRNPKLVPA